MPGGLTALLQGGPDTLLEAAARLKAEVLRGMPCAALHPRYTHCRKARGARPPLLQVEGCSSVDSGLDQMERQLPSQEELDLTSEVRSPPRIPDTAAPAPASFSCPGGRARVLLQHVCALVGVLAGPCWCYVCTGCENENAPRSPNQEFRCSRR